MSQSSTSSSSLVGGARPKTHLSQNSSTTDDGILDIPGDDPPPDDNELQLDEDELARAIMESLRPVHAAPLVTVADVVKAPAPAADFDEREIQLALEKSEELERQKRLFNEVGENFVVRV